MFGQLEQVKTIMFAEDCLFVLAKWNIWCYEWMEGRDLMKHTYTWEERFEVYSYAVESCTAQDW